MVKFKNMQRNLWSKYNFSKDLFKSEIMKDYFIQTTATKVKLNLSAYFKIVSIIIVLLLIKSINYNKNFLFLTIRAFILIVCIYFGLYLILMRYNFSKTHIAILGCIAYVLALLYLIIDFTIDEQKCPDLLPTMPIMLSSFLFLPINWKFIFFGGMLYTVLLAIVANVEDNPSMGREICKVSLTMFPTGSLYIAATETITVLFIILNVVGLYSRCVQSYVLTTSFHHLGNQIKARLDCAREQENKIRIIGAILPAEVLPDYMNFLKEKHAISRNKLAPVFSRKWLNVSILYADIVGFTKISSTRPALELVGLLNDLFRRYDQLTELNDCLKVGTMGDGYYCVSGCPQERSDHAECIIFTGLQMCAATKAFDEEREENVHIRVGVHSGFLHVAIIGIKRIRFDVFSYDCLLANKIETSGQAGHVLVTQTTRRLAGNRFRFRPGPVVHFRTIKNINVGGFRFVDNNIETYFVVDRENYLSQNRSVFGKHYNLESITEDSLKRLTTSSKERTFSKETSNVMGEKSKVDLDLIEMFRTDPEREIQVFSNPPVHEFTHCFLNPDLEEAFRLKLCDQYGAYVGSYIKKLPLLNCIATTFYLTIFLAFVLPLMTSWPYYLNILLLLNTCNAGSLFLFLLLRELFFHRKSNFVTEVVLFRYFSWLGQNVVMGLTYALVVLLYTLSLEPLQAYRSHAHYATHCEMAKFSLTFGLFIQGLSNIWLTLLCFASTLYVYGSLVLPYFIAPDHTNTTCVGTLYCDERSLPILLPECISLLYFMSCGLRENDLNCRLSFHTNYHSTKRKLEMEKEKKSAENLLYSILPKHLCDRVISQQGTFVIQLNYAIDVEEAGVVFAGIDNFFSFYYNEAFKQGEKALQLLNGIICSFDFALSKGKFFEVEKIKTIGDCYLCASGLNADWKKVSSANSKSHLLALMEFCYEMLTLIEQFNESYIVGKENWFSLKIGYNIGPLIAGIIGRSRPYYDIWGDTVNVASRMHSTGRAGHIQVTQSVFESMPENVFTFTPRGPVHVKGKGLLQTYFVYKQK